MSSPERIPTPISQIWREFRIRFLPLFVFAIVVSAAATIWKQNIGAPSVLGAAEAASTPVASPQPGTLVELKVDRFQMVQKGAPIAVIAPSDIRTAFASIQSELNILRSQLEPRLAQQRNATDYERLRLEMLLQKVELATARVNHQRAQNELKRDQELFAQNLISADVFDLAQKTEELLAVEIQERTKLIENVEEGLKRLQGLGDITYSAEPTEAALVAIEAEREKLKTAQSLHESIVLVAPIDGMVTSILHRAGENVRESDPIVVISAAQPERIVSYMRQPFPFEPKVGMQVEVRTRTLQNQSGLAHIRQVGAQFEPITNALAMVRQGTLMDMGLPIEISLPPTLKLRPSEVVDIIVRAQ